ncbi:UTP3 small subunit processome component Sas10 [Osmia lignaria lignaria]|uniref:UTP3 small subunit processome component Sas10 n=1 Tax=Osmia lignaria lignaria TaxID=1437193 RepID=UPI00147820C3|nr:something about silencing protein 10-like [Osmia lignaria]
MKIRKRTKLAEMHYEPEDLEDVNMNEVTDSEEEYSESERKLLQDVRSRHSSESYDSDYEVYKLNDDNGKDQVNSEDEAQTDSMESDIEGLDNDFDLPNEKAWGKKKKAYYSTDYVDADFASITQKDLAEAELEEQEARNIQKRLAEQLDDADFGLDFIQSKKSDEQESHEDTKQLVKSDFSKLSKRQKQALMQKESPEFVALVNDFKDRMGEVRDTLTPFMRLVNKDILPSCPAVSFIKTKYHLLLNYCINISFYLMLKAKRLPVNSHPVIKRLAQYRQLLNQLESGQGNLMQEVQEILKAQKQGKPLYNIFNGAEINGNEQKTNNSSKEKSKYPKKSAKKIKSSSVPEFESEAEAEPEFEIEEKESVSEENLENDEDMAEENQVKDIKIIDTVIDSQKKRAITYQIAKNKGLTPHRKKEQRNPRVKHRNKYRKAKIRRKGAVREVRKEVTRYAGEISGIKASVKKSIKLK